MATKLKKMKLTSVDLVRAGANQKADICLYKSANPPQMGEFQQTGKNTGYNIGKTSTVDHQGKRGNNMLKIDKSRFDADELEAYNYLIAKALVDPEAGEEEMEEEMPPAETEKKKRPRFFEEPEETEKGCNTKKSIDPEFAEALQRQQERLEALEKSAAMKEFTEIAKKYAPLGEDEATLAKTLYDMHNASEDSYNAYIGLLDKSLNVVEKSGIFAEIGKSGNAAGDGTTVGRVETIAKSYMESDPTMTPEQAMVKAWESNPELIAEYDREYRA